MTAPPRSEVYAYWPWAVPFQDPTLSITTLPSANALLSGHRLVTRGHGIKSGGGGSGGMGGGDGGAGTQPTHPYKAAQEVCVLSPKDWEALLNRQNK